MNKVWVSKKVKKNSFLRPQTHHCCKYFGCACISLEYEPQQTTHQICSTSNPLRLSLCVCVCVRVCVRVRVYATHLILSLVHAHTPEHNSRPCVYACELVTIMHISLPHSI